MRARLAKRQTLFDAFSFFFDELAISQETVDLEEAIALTEQTRLSLSDASYLWLARAPGAELVTLDGRVSVSRPTFHVKRSLCA